MSGSRRILLFTIGLALLALFIIANAYVAYANIRSVRQHARERLVSNRVIAVLQFVMLDLDDMETGQRGYILTGEPRYLRPYLDASQRLDADLQNLRTTMPDGATRISTLDQAAHAKAAELADTVALFRSGQRRQAMDIVVSGRGQGYMEQARAAAQPLVQEEQQRMQEFDRSTEASVDRALRSALVADGVVLVLALLLFWYALSYARRLETQVQLRTADLKQSNRQLESYNFIISHDLRAPMRTMLGFATALEEDFGTSVPPDLADYIQRIKNAGQHMTRLINDLLAYSRLQRAEVPLTSVSLEQVARQAAARVAQAGGGGVQKIDVPGDAIVTANPQVLQQAVDNLVDNARKFTKPGSANRVEISARRAGSMWRLEVSDSGIGIKPEHQQEIFEVFRRLHSSEQYEGTGAGLAIVKTGVERMGGRVGVKSAAGEGSTFWIELPTSAK